MKYNFNQSIGRLSSIVSSSLGKSIVAKFKENNIKLTSYEWTILSYLANNDIQNQNQLADAIGKDKVAVTRYLSDMEFLGYIERKTSDTDKRSNIVVLTKSGDNVYNSVVKLVEEVLKGAYKNISDTDLKTTISVLQKITENQELK